MREQLQSERWKKLVGELEDLLAERRGVTEVSRAVSAFRFELGQESNDLFLPFVGIDSETDSFPMGNVRARWNPDSLAALDRERVEFEARLRPHAVQAAKRLLAYARAYAL